MRRVSCVKDLLNRQLFLLVENFIRIQTNVEPNTKLVTLIRVNIVFECIVCGVYTREVGIERGDKHKHLIECMVAVVENGQNTANKLVVRHIDVVHIRVEIGVRV